MRALSLSSMMLALALTATASPGAAAVDQAAAEDLPVRTRVLDPAGDARGSMAVRDAADLRRVAYRTPSRRVGGTMTIRATWERLRGPRHRDGVRQVLTTFVDLRTDDDGPVGFAIGGSPGPFALYVLRDGDDELRRVRPDDLRIERTYGALGTTTVTMSMEWLTGRRAWVSTFADADSDRGLAFDDTRSRRMRVGPRG